MMENRIRIPVQEKVELTPKCSILQEKMDFFIAWRTFVTFTNPQIEIEDQMLAFHPAGEKDKYCFMVCKLWLRFKNE